MIISEEIKNRIIVVAEKILSESGKMPTVAEVRSAAQTDMNSTSTVMKEWRQQKLLPEKKIEEEAPKEVQEDALTLASKIWTTAKQQAEKKLIDAEAEFKRERDEAESMRVELSTECDTLQGTIKTLGAELADNAKTLQKLEADKAELQKAEQAALTKAEVANAKNIELEKLITNLRYQLEELSKQKDQEATIFKAAAEKDAKAISTLEDILVKAQKAIAEKDIKAERQAATIDQLQERITDYKGQITDYKEQIKVSEKLRAESEKTATKMEADLQGATKQLQQAQQIQAKLQTLLEQALKKDPEKTPSEK